MENEVKVRILSCNEEQSQKLQRYWSQTETDFTKYEGKMDFLSFQSIYTSLLTNEIILKELNKKRRMKINFNDRTNWIGKGRE
jgi:hypothetical protein